MYCSHDDDDTEYLVYVCHSTSHVIMVGPVIGSHLWMSMIVAGCLTVFDVVVVAAVDVGTCVRVVGLVIVVELVFPCLLKRNKKIK